MSHAPLKSRSRPVLVGLFIAASAAPILAQTAASVPGGAPAPRTPVPALQRGPSDPARPADSFGVAGRIVRPAPMLPPVDPDRPAADQAGDEPRGDGGVSDIGVQTIDFESLSHADAQIAGAGDVYIEDGWFVSQDPGQSYPLSTFGTQESRWPGSTAMFNRNVNGVTYLYPVEGAFTLVSVDVSNLNANGKASVTFIGHRYDGSTVSRTCTTSTDANRLDTFYFPDFNNLWYVEWVQASPYHQFDNIRVSRAPVVLDFEDFAHDDAGAKSIGSQINENGFLITQGPNEPSKLCTFGLQSPKFPGSTALFNNTVNGTITLTDYLDGPFTVHSIDISNLNNDGPTSVTFIGVRQDNGTIQKTFKTKGAPNGLQHFEFEGFTNLTSLTWTQDSPFHQFDNIVISRGQSVMDFTKLSIADAGLHPWGKHYREDGFQLDTDSGPGYYSFGTLEPRWPGSTSLFDNGVGGRTTLTSIDGSPFGIISIALAPLSGADAQSITFTGTRPNGTVVDQTFKLSGQSQRLETFNFDPKFRRVQKVEWKQNSPFHQFDAITLVPSNVALIDFQSLEHPGTGYVYAGSSYEENGFRISKGPVDPFGLAVYGTKSDSYPGSTALFHNTAGGKIRLDTVSGNDFDLLQMDVSRLGNNGPDGTVTFVGHKTDGSTIQQSFTYYGANVGLQTVQFTGFDTLEYVEWTQSSPYHQFDNIAVIEGLPSDNCYADFNDDGVLDLFDFLAYVNAFNAADASANCDGNGSLDLFDFLCYVNAFNAGC